MICFPQILIKILLIFHLSLNKIRKILFSTLFDSFVPNLKTKIINRQQTTETKKENKSNSFTFDSFGNFEGQDAKAHQAKTESEPTHFTFDGFNNFSTSNQTVEKPIETTKPMTFDNFGDFSQR